MLCDHCKKHEAVVHITKIENGRRTDIHLCADCAGKQSPFGSDGESNIVDNDFFRKMAYPDHHGRYGEELRCNSCGTTYEEFNRNGKFGCPDCYETFAEEATPLLRRQTRRQGARTGQRRVSYGNTAEAASATSAEAHCRGSV